MQDAVLPLQCLDLVAPEKRADTLGDVGSCGRRSPFQPLGLYLLFRPYKLLLCRIFPFLQFHHLRFQFFSLTLYVTVVLLRGNVPCVRTVNHPLQPVFRHRCGIAVLIGFQFQTVHDVIGAQPHAVGRLFAVAFLRLLLPFPALALPLALLGNFQRCLQCGSENSLISYGIFCPQIPVRRPSLPVYFVCLAYLLCVYDNVNRVSLICEHCSRHKLPISRFPAGLMTDENPLN